jgi:hypothetical protein
VITTNASSTTMKYAVDVRPSTHLKRVLDGTRTFVISSAPPEQAASSGRVESFDEQPDAGQTPAAEIRRGHVRP